MVDQIGVGLVGFQAVMLLLARHGSVGGWGLLTVATISNLPSSSRSPSAADDARQATVLSVCNTAPSRSRKILIHLPYCCPCAQLEPITISGPGLLARTSPITGDE